MWTAAPARPAGPRRRRRAGASSGELNGIDALILAEDEGNSRSRFDCWNIPPGRFVRSVGNLASLQTADYSGSLHTRSNPQASHFDWRGKAKSLSPEFQCDQGDF